MKTVDQSTHNSFRPQAWLSIFAFMAIIEKISAILTTQATFIKTLDFLPRTVIPFADNNSVVIGPSVNGNKIYLAPTITDSNNNNYTALSGVSLGDNGNAASPTKDGGFILTGCTNNLNIIFIAKWNRNMELEWAKRVSNGLVSCATHVTQTSDSGYVLTGYTYVNPSNSFLIIKLNELGDFQWAKSLDNPNDNNNGVGYAVQEVGDGGFIATGFYANPLTFQDLPFTKWSKNGDLEWIKFLSGYSGEKAHALCKTTDGNVAFAGVSGSFGSNDADIILGKLNYNGSLAWSAVLGKGNVQYDAGYGIAQTSDGNLVVVGTSFSNQRRNDAIIAKYTENGVRLWVKGYDNRAEEYGYGITEAHDYGLLLVGTNGMDSGFVAEFTSDGDIDNCSGTYVSSLATALINPDFITGNITAINRPMISSAYSLMYEIGVINSSDICAIRNRQVNVTLPAPTTVMPTTSATSFITETATHSLTELTTFSSGSSSYTSFPSSLSTTTSQIFSRMNLTDTQSNSSPNVGIIIGAVVGSLAFCSLVVIAAICFLKKKNRSLSPFPSPPPVPSPFPSFEIDPKTITIIELIGSGGFGNVYRARWHETDVAVKELKQDIVTAKKLAEFYREFQAMVELSSPNVVKLYGMTMRKPYQIVMELVENGSLYSLLSNNRNVSWGIRIQIISDIANALLYIHSASVIHRDLKSLNVLLTQDHRAKICDFGLAIMNAKDGEQNSENNAVGSTRWMAPELFCDNPQYTTKSDIFSNGIVIWEVCHLKIPFSELENADVRKAIKAGKTEPISDETPLLLGKLITECLRMDPMERPSATEISNSFPTIHSDIDIVVDTEAVMKQGFFSQKRNASSKKSPRYEEATTASQEHKTF